MNKRHLAGWLFALLLSSGTANATTEDVSATLSVSGKVNSTSDRCQVTLNKEMLSLYTSVSDMVNQGSDATDPEFTNIYISNIGNGDSCAQAAQAGHISVRFVGQADDADGTTLANSYLSQNSAKGVGMGIFREDNTPVAINEDTLSVPDATGKTVFGIQAVKLTNQAVSPGTLYGRLIIQIERL
ncbi:type 1 fimbrial protein [Cronobacter malonaticus]|uniref:Type 1 fimbrial protein n=1 Tax=Cronobacter malonaticus TaxID=413503 RepID=A0A423XWG1_9ENTR|nr:fimbrial protein [Cronobacter malonaticus]EGT4373584.1 type 1 fimbrial protein [Cronobacter malonaticus]EGT4385446.1 type 1 fimbrial protein [Cronobacter malonaticus]EGT4422831.1 type 1 fimbrial protein [Cronobacter malonaticus]EGT4447218.1 type 1 fimbrial protein [Cronobacter malonaticus]EGT4455934.1 type 1 fimbrial protein [Cronobacter malonaticus]